jgi:hypothetical protein
LAIFEVKLGPWENAYLTVWQNLYMRCKHTGDGQHTLSGPREPRLTWKAAPDSGEAVELDLLPFSSHWTSLGFLLSYEGTHGLIHARALCLLATPLVPKGLERPEQFVFVFF